MPWEIVKPVIDPDVRKLCVKAYPNHPKGCPNFGKKDCCPPKVSLIADTFKMDAPIYGIWNEYPFGQHVAKMKAAHPDWSERQLACCLYWQGTARKQLKGIIKKFLEQKGSDLMVTTCPEAQGVNLTATMKSIGVELEWPPREVTYQIALAGHLK